MSEQDILAMRGEFGKCGHCGHEWTYIERARYTFSPDPDSGITITWRLLQCIACRKVSLTEFYSEDDFGHVLYPSIRIDIDNLPRLVAKPYEEMLRVRYISPIACAVMAGRTLEAICITESAVGRTLADKLQHLANAGRIPETLARMAHQLRQIRNMGAHFADDEPTEADAPLILDFVEAILEYLYVAPAKIAAVEVRLRTRIRDEYTDTEIPF